MSTLVGDPLEEPMPLGAATVYLNSLSDPRTAQALQCGDTALAFVGQGKMWIRIDDRIMLWNMDAGTEVTSYYVGNSNFRAFRRPRKVVNEFYFGNRFPRVVVTKQTEEEDAHSHTCEEPLRTNKSQTVNSLFTLFISLNCRRLFYYSNLVPGTDQ